MHASERPYPGTHLLAALELLAIQQAENPNVMCRRAMGQYVCEMQGLVQ